MCLFYVFTIGHIIKRLYADFDLSKIKREKKYAFYKYFDIRQAAIKRCVGKR